MRSPAKNKAASKKEPLNQRIKRTISPQKVNVTSAPNSGGIPKSKLL